MVTKNAVFMRAVAFRKRLVNVHIERVVASISDTELLDKITECVKIQIGAYEKYN